MVLDLVRERYRNLLDRVTLGRCKESVLFHTGNNEISSFKRPLRIEGRIVSCRLVHHSHKSGRFLDGQVDRRLSEEGLSRSLDAVCVAAEENLVHVHVHDLVLGVASFELDRSHPFLEFGPDHLEYRTAHILSRIQGLGKLLGDGTSTSLARTSSDHGLYKHTGKTFEVDSGMSVESGVFGSHSRIDKVRGKFLITYI